MTDSIVIIGAGQAGLQSAVSLRKFGFSGDIVLAGDEPHAPYQRPPLSKKFLAGEIEIERLHLKPNEFFREAEITLELGTAVTAINTESNMISFEDGGVRPYDKAILATGTQPRQIAIPGGDLDGVMTLRKIADVERFRPYIAGGNKVAIVGGGYIGLEVAAVARSLGLDVTVFEASERVMQRVVSPEISQFYENLHAANGVAVHTNLSVNQILGEKGHCRAIETTDRQVFDADLILIAVGAEPKTSLAENAGLEVSNGICVNRFGMTSNKNIFAAGDCTSFPSGRYDRRVRLESVQNAIDQAKSVAAALTGTPEAYDPVPWFWSDQYDVKLQIAGLSQGYDRAEVRGNPASGAFSVVYSKMDTLLAVDSINQARAHMLARRAIGGLVSDFDWQG